MLHNDIFQRIVLLLLFWFQILEATEALNSRIVATLLDVLIGPTP